MNIHNIPPFNPEDIAVYTVILVIRESSKKFGSALRVGAVILVILTVLVTQMVTLSNKRVEGVVNRTHRSSLQKSMSRYSKKLL